MRTKTSVLSPETSTVSLGEAITCNKLAIVRFVSKYVFYYTEENFLSAMQIFLMVNK